MKGIFVNENGGIRYAEALVSGFKTIETRNRNMLAACCGERVAVVRTRRGKNPEVIGTVYMGETPLHVRAEVLDTLRDETLIPPGSLYDPKPGTRKWCYFCGAGVKFDKPYPLPKEAVRHGRSWCEF